MPTRKSKRLVCTCTVVSNLVDNIMFNKVQAHPSRAQAGERFLMANLHYIISTNSMVIFKLGLYCKALAKRSQHFTAANRNMVRLKMLRPFGHPVASGYDMLGVVGQIFHATFVDVAWCCSLLARFVQQCCAWACALVWFSTRNMPQDVAQGGQTRATCCARQGCDLLRSTVAIVWLEVANAGQTMLGYVALRCC